MQNDTNAIENIKNLSNVFQTLDTFGWISAAIEIIIIAVAISYVLIWIKNTRAWALLRGIIVIAMIVFLAYFFNFKVLLAIFRALAGFAFIAIIVIFQGDIRSGLEKLGRKKFLLNIVPDLNKLTKKASETTVQEIVQAAFAMGKVKTGALIVLERLDSLEDVERTGISINGKVSKQLLINIFEKNTPLHDGAVLIVGDTIKAATCYLPLSRNENISKELGTRHRAALGISESTDSETIVVSEETGNVSICSGGEIKIMHDEKELVKELMDTIYHQEGNKDKEKKQKDGWALNVKKA